MTRNKILLVEDDANDLELTKRALQRARLANEIVVARDGEQALDLFFSGEPGFVDEVSLVLLDLKLPKVDGLEVLQKLKSEASTKAIPIVVMTSSQEQRDLVESYKLGVNSYVVKPLAFADFGAAVAQLGMYWLLLNQLPDKE